MHNLKAENYWGQYEYLSQGYRLSVALRDSSEEGREEPGYIGVFATKSRQSELQVITVK